MANLPFNKYSIPWADPPISVRLYKKDELLLETDDCGVKFNIVGDVHSVAMACIERAIDRIKDVSNNNFRHRDGAIRFIVENRQIIRAEPEFQERIPHAKHMPEDRPEVLELIEVINKSLQSMMKMNA